MTEPRDADRLISAYLSEGPVELADRSYEAVRDRIEGTRQRSGFGAWSLPALSDSARVVLVAGAILIAFVAGVEFVGGLGAGGERPPVASPSQSTSASPRTPPPLFGLDTTLQPGTYRLTSVFPVDLTVDVPFGWSACIESAAEQVVCAPAPGAPDEVSVSFLVVENVVADPCISVGLDPPVGGTVGDLAAAIAGLQGFEATTPVDVTVDGHVGEELIVSAPAESSCDSLYTWATADRANGVGLGEVNRLRIVDVDGVRVMIAAAWFRQNQSLDQPPELKRVFESVRFPRD